VTVINILNNADISHDMAAEYKGDVGHSSGKLEIEKKLVN